MKTIKKIASSRALYIVLSCILSVILWLYVASYANTDMEAELTGLEIDYVGGDDILRDRKLLVTEKDQQSVSLTILGKRNEIDVRTFDFGEKPAMLKDMDGKQVRSFLGDVREVANAITRDMDRFFEKVKGVPDKADAR